MYKRLKNTSIVSIFSSCSDLQIQQGRGWFWLLATMSLNGDSVYQRVISQANAVSTAQHCHSCLVWVGGGQIA